MRVFITGAAGFVGGHAIRDFRQAGHTVVAMVAPGQAMQRDDVEAVETLDLLDAAALADAIARHRPDACLHLAGIAFVPQAWKQPQQAIAVNVNGTLNVLEAFRTHRRDARVLAVTSAQIYGNAHRDDVLHEDMPPEPETLYALSKAAADGAALLYAREYNMPVMTARPCNHIGPGQSESFVVSAFARQLIAIQRGAAAPVMKVGNLASRREFTDVRDMVRAYRLLLEKGHGGLAYNVASGKLITIQALLDTMCGIAGVRPEVEVDPALFRPTDTQPTLDIRRLIDHTGWRPEIALTDTLRDVLADFSHR